MPTKRKGGGSTWVDPDDAPELTDEYFRHADVYEGERLVRRGRPKLVDPKQPVNIRLSPRVLEHFRASGRGWQTRISDALEQLVTRAKRKR